MVIRGAKVYTGEHKFREKDIVVSGERIVGESLGRGAEAVQGVPCVADVPGVQGVLCAADAPGVQGVPQAAGVPGVQGVPRAADVPGGGVSGAGTVLDAGGLYAIPGLVDIHFHGAAGHDFCDGDLEGLGEIAEFQARRGVLAICPATMSYNEEILGKIMDNAASYKRLECRRGRRKGADLIGINMEGPFVNPQKSGAQNPEYLMNPDVGMFRRLQERSGGLIRLVDLAPELDGAMEFIESCRDEAVISLAHSCADYETAVQAFRRGARHVTHLYNAMPGFCHREPGPLAAALEEGAMVELICDGVHVHPAAVRFTFRVFGADKVVLISDSMRACGMPDGIYRLGGQEVAVRRNRAVLADRPDTIAGSVTCLYGCMRKAVLEMGVPLEDAVRAASENPARAAGAGEDYGSLEPGHYADIVLVDDELEIRGILQKGVVRFGLHYS